jgi:hypothetical protein
MKNVIFATVRGIATGYTSLSGVAGVILKRDKNCLDYRKFQNSRMKGADKENVSIYTNDYLGILGMFQFQCLRLYDY